MEKKLFGKSEKKFIDEADFLCKYLYELCDEGFEEKEIVYILIKVFSFIIGVFGFSKEVIDVIHKTLLEDFNSMKEHKKSLSADE